MSLLKVEKPELVIPEKRNLVFKKNPSPDNVQQLFYSLFGEIPVWQLNRDGSFGDDDVVSRTEGAFTGRAWALEAAFKKEVLIGLQKERGYRRPILSCIALVPKTNKERPYARIILPRAHTGRDAILRG